MIQEETEEKGIREKDHQDYKKIKREKDKKKKR